MNVDKGIRLLTGADVAEFRNLRLEALHLNPALFGASHEDEQRQPLSYFQHMLSESQWFGAFEGQRLIAMAALRRPVALQLKHRASLWGMYVQPEYRRQKRASELMAHIINAARTIKIEQIELRVIEQNADAQQFYLKHGFKKTGHNLKAVKLSENEYLDDLTMVLDL